LYISGALICHRNEARTLESLNTQSRNILLRQIRWESQPNFATTVANQRDYIWQRFPKLREPDLGKSDFVFWIWQTALLSGGTRKPGHATSDKRTMGNLQKRRGFSLYSSECTRNECQDLLLWWYYC